MYWERGPLDDGGTGTKLNEGMQGLSWMTREPGRMNWDRAGTKGERNMLIGIVDYGAGNLLSVRNALDFLKVESKLVRSRKDMAGIKGLVLPGVGAFEPALEMLRSKKLDQEILAWLEADRPFLGICLGLQLLFEGSEEAPGVKGLSIFKGNVLRFSRGRVPQIGWNQVAARKGSRFFGSLRDGEFFYFLHSYYVKPASKDIIAGTTEHGISYASAVERGNALAVQFHPEKSGDAGLKLLANWVRICRGRGMDAKGHSGGN